MSESKFIRLRQDEIRAIYYALVRGAELDGEDVHGLFMKATGHAILDDAKLNDLIRKLQEGGGQPEQFNPSKDGEYCHRCDLNHTGPCLDRNCHDWRVARRGWMGWPPNPGERGRIK